MDFTFTPPRFPEVRNSGGASGGEPSPYNDASILTNQSDPVNSKNTELTNPSEWTGPFNSGRSSVAKFLRNASEQRMNVPSRMVLDPHYAHKTQQEASRASTSTRQKSSQQEPTLQASTPGSATIGRCATDDEPSTTPRRTNERGDILVEPAKESPQNPPMNAGKPNPPSVSAVSIRSEPLNSVHLHAPIEAHPVISIITYLGTRIEIHSHEPSHAEARWQASGDSHATRPGCESEGPTTPLSEPSGLSPLNGALDS